MKKLLFFLGVSLCLASGAHAKNVAPKFDPWSNMPLPRLEAVAGKRDVWKIQPGAYKARDFFEMLAAKSGGKAIFADDFGVSLLSFEDAQIGTASELIESWGFGTIAVGKVGADWVFVRVKPKTPVAVSKPVFLAPTKREPFQFKFNANSMAKTVDSKTLPPSAKAFEFNSGRVYHVPMQPQPK